MALVIILSSHYFSVIVPTLLYGIISSRALEFTIIFQRCRETALLLVLDQDYTVVVDDLTIWKSVPC